MRHFLNDVEISPRNRQEIGIVSDYTDNPDVLRLSTDNIVLPREGYDIIRNHISQVGVFEGIPYRIEMAGGVNLEYYVDLTEQTVIRQHDVEVKIKSRKGYDSFWDNANGTSFELLLAKNVQFDIFEVPYFVIKDNQLEQAITISLSIFVMSKEIAEAAKELVASISEVVQASTPNIGVPPSVDTGDIIAAALKAVARLIYFAAILVALLNLAAKLFALIFPPKYKLKACKVKELLVKGCQYLGYTFESSLLNAIPQLTLLPVPLVKQRSSIFEFLPEELNAPFNKGIPSASDTTPTLGSLLEALKVTFNAQVKVYNGVVRLERRDWWMLQSSNQLIPAMSLQSERDDAFSYNTDEVWKRYYIHYALDASDLNTYDWLYDYSDAEYSTEPVSYVNQDLVTIKGLNDVAIPFALARRKEKLNWLELLAKGLFTVVDAVTGIFGGGTSYATQIGERKDCMQVSQMYWSTTKLLYAINGKQPSYYMDFMSAKALWNQYHKINEIQLNAWKVKNDVRIRLRAIEFVNLLDNNWVEIDGQLCEVLNCEWYDEKSDAKITYRLPDSYATGKVFTLTINE